MELRQKLAKKLVKKHKFLILDVAKLKHSNVVVEITGLFYDKDLYPVYSVSSGALNSIARENDLEAYNGAFPQV